MKLKQGVDMEGVLPPIWFALGIAEVIYRNMQRDLVVTSLCEGQHKEGSLHYKGLAADLRTNHLTNQERKDVMSRLAVILQPMGYDVILEPTHVHLESDPKGDEVWYKYTI